MTPHWMYGDTVIQADQTFDFGNLTLVGSVVSKCR